MKIRIQLTDNFFMFHKKIVVFIFFFFFIQLVSLYPHQDIWDEIDLEIKKYIESLDPQTNEQTEKILEQIESNEDALVEFNNVSSNKREIIEYTVQENDTLFLIAKKFNMNISDIFSLNPYLVSQGKIYIGDKLKVFKSEGQLIEKISDSDGWIYRRVVKIYVKKYKVKKRDTLFKIAKKFNAKTDTLISYNKLNQHIRLRVNQLLIVNKKKVIKEYKIRNYFLNPIEGGVISSNYGFRMNPFIRNMRNFHKGIDIVADMGTPIRSAKEGIVIYSGRMEGYGNVIFVRHKDHYITVYAHNKVNKVKVGDIVKRGMVIAEVGMTGYVTGPHLHFEIRKFEKTINPISVLNLKEKINLFIRQISLR